MLLYVLRGNVKQRCNKIQMIYVRMRRVESEHNIYKYLYKALYLSDCPDYMYIHRLMEAYMLHCVLCCVVLISVF